MTDATSAPSGLADLLFGCPNIMGPSSALAEDEELSPLMTDFASGPLDRDPPCLFAAFGGFSAPTATVFSGAVPLSAILEPRAEAVVVTVGLVPSTTVSVLPRSSLPPRLLAPTLPSPPRAMAADEVMAVDTDKADFLSEADASVLRGFNGFSTGALASATLGMLQLAGSGVPGAGPGGVPRVAPGAVP